MRHCETLDQDTNLQGFVNGVLNSYENAMISGPKDHRVDVYLSRLEWNGNHEVQGNLYIIEVCLRRGRQILKNG